MKLLRTLGSILLPIIAVWDVVTFLGLKWSAAVAALNDLGMAFVEDHFVLILLLVVTLGMIGWLYTTRNLRLVVAKCRQEVSIEDHQRATVTTTQDLRAYVDNVTAMFTVCTADPLTGSIDRERLSFNILTSGIGSTQKIEDGPTAWSIKVTHRFSKALPIYWGLPWQKPIKRRSSVSYLNSFSLDSDHYIFATDKYQTGELELDVVFPPGKKPGLVTAEMIIDHGVYDLEIKEICDTPRNGCTTYRINERPPKNIMAKYKIEWASKPRA